MLILPACSWERYRDVCVCACHLKIKRPWGESNDNSYSDYYNLFFTYIIMWQCVHSVNILAVFNLLLCVCLGLSISLWKFRRQRHISNFSMNVVKLRGDGDDSKANMELHVLVFP